MTGLKLQPATDSDLEFLHAVYASGRIDELASIPWTVEQKSVFLRSQSETQLSYYNEHYADAELSVVTLDGTDIGRIFVEVGASDLRLMDMGLLPEARNRGVGSELLRSVIDRAESLGLPVVLHVEGSNPAKRLYERFGFVDEGEVGPYHRMRLGIEVTA